jgi:hypothetical protein
MKKIPVSGTDLESLLETFQYSLLYGRQSPILYLSAVKTARKYNVVINQIDATIWNQPLSYFNNEPGVKKHLIVHGWIDKEFEEKFSSSVPRNCKIELHTSGEIFLIKKRKKN